MANHVPTSTTAQLRGKIEQGLASFGYRMHSGGGLDAQDWKSIEKFYAEKLPEMHLSKAAMHRRTPQQMHDDVKKAVIANVDALLDRPQLTGYETGKVQERLKWLELYDGKIDQDFGPKLEKAADAFDKKYAPQHLSEYKAQKAKAEPHEERTPQNRASHRVKVVIDAGHGFKQGKFGCYDIGAHCDTVYEADVVMRHAKKVAEKLKDRGYDVVLTRNNSFDAGDAPNARDVKQFSTQSDSLRHRVQIAQKQVKQSKDVLFVSIHADSAGKSAQGVSVHYAPNDKNSAEFAKAVADQFNDAPHTDKDDRRADTKATTKASGFQVLRGAKAADIPGILLETGFISNAADRKRITSAAGIENIAEQLADAIEQFKPLATPKAKGKNPHLRS